MATGMFVLGCVFVAIGIPMHFWILARVDGVDGTRVEYFATIFAWFRTYRTYARVAPERGWSRWPLYLVYCAYAGLIFGALGLVMDRTLLDSIVRLSQR